MKYMIIKIEQEDDETISADIENLAREDMTELENAVSNALESGIEMLMKNMAKPGTYELRNKI